MIFKMNLIIQIMKEEIKHKINNTIYLIIKCLIIGVIILFSSCSRKVEIKDQPIDQVFNNYMFCGVEPDLSYKELCNRVGEPNDFYEYEDDYETSHNPLYYTPSGKIMCWWAGYKKYPIGNVEFTPHRNVDINISDILDVNLSDYNIKSNTKKIKLMNENYPFIYFISLDNFKVTKIWMGTNKNYKR